MGYRMDNGYRRMWAKTPDGKPKLMLMHRFMYLVSIGPIPEGYQVDHTCGAKACCNPAHLEAVTPAENARRSVEARGLTVQHGTKSCYSQGCRQPECLAAATQYQRDYRAAKKLAAIIIELPIAPAQPTTTETDAA